MWQVWFKNRRAKFRKKQRASKSHSQRTDSPTADGGSSIHCKTKDEPRRGGLADSQYHTDDDTSPLPDTAPQAGSDRVDQEEEEEKTGVRLKSEHETVFHGDVRRFSPTTGGSGSADDSRISALAFHRGLHPYHCTFSFAFSILFVFAFHLHIILYPLSG